MAESTQTLDAVLTLPPADASARLLEMADGAESVRDVLKRVMEGRYPAAPGMLVAASVLANSDPRFALLQPAYDLGQLVLSQVAARRDPAVAQRLRILLAQLEENFAGTNDIDPTKRRHIIAQLSRARAILALDAGEVGEGRSLLVESLDQYEQLQHKSGIAALALDLSGVEWSLKDTSATVEYLIKAADQLSDQPPAAQGLQQAILGALVGRAESLYYDLQDSVSAIWLARRATELEPGEAAPWQLLAAACKRVDAREQGRQRRRGLRAPGVARS